MTARRRWSVEIDGERGTDHEHRSVEYYTRLERGNANGVSEHVLEGIARALQLDEAERAHSRRRSGAIASWGVNPRAVGSPGTMPTRLCSALQPVERRVRRRKVAGDGRCRMKRGL
jgi:hypothetical protein